MASVAAPPEDVAMGVLGKDGDGKTATQLDTQEDSFEDCDTTLLWGQSPCGSIRETVALEASDARPSPEGSREEAVSGPAVDDGSLDRSTRTPSSISTKEEEEEESNAMPKVASHVFVPIDPYCIERKMTGNDAEKQRRWERGETGDEEAGNLEKRDFLPRGGHSARFDDPPSDNGREGAKACADRLPCLRNGTCSSANLKGVASMAGAAILFPCLVYGAYVFLPFDAPLMPTMGSRLVYTLRCGAFATFPIVLGMMVYGVSRLCFSSLQPFGEPPRREVEIHRRYVSQSVNLFILYFFNIAVLATYLPQEGLKLVPLLTALFAISRLLYWLAFAMGRSFRGFGFGLTFLPLVAMLLFNLYSMFLVDSENLFATEGGPADHKDFRPRYWG